MSNSPVELIFSRHFIKRAKKLTRRFRNFETDLHTLTNQLKSGQTPGEQMTGIGYTAYKVRLSSQDMQRGKSGGYRVIYYLRTVRRVVMLDIYAKSDQSDIAPEIVRSLIEEYLSNESNNLI